MNKRGISPLIATVLLIAFTVAIAAMIMNWGKGVNVSESVSCDDIKMEIQQLNGKPAFCYDVASQKVRILLKNTGKTDIDALQFRAIGSDLNIYEAKVDDSSLKKGQIKKIEYTYVKGGKFHVEFVPTIIGEEEVYCSEKSVSVDELVPC